MKLVTLTIVMMSWLSGGLVHAAALEPTRASQTVNLAADPGSSVCSGACCLLTTRINGDGTSTAGFTIPSGKVLVLDGLSWSQLAGTRAPGATAILTLQVTSGSPTQIWFDSATANASGGVTAQTSALPNIVVKSGQSVCGTPDSGGAIVRVHGFLASDK